MIKYGKPVVIEREIENKKDFKIPKFKTAIQVLADRIQLEESLLTPVDEVEAEQ
jgi:hypothetical protein